MRLSCLLCREVMCGKVDLLVMSLISEVQSSESEDIHELVHYILKRHVNNKKNALLNYGYYYYSCYHNIYNYNNYN